MNPLDDPLRVSPEGRLFLARHKFCPWTGKPLAPLIGLRLGQFRIERAISTAGGFGVVYYARNVDQEEVEAAIKVLKPPHCYNKEMVRVFLYEAGLGRGLGVSQIPKIFNVAREPWPHITMEYIEGHTLQEEFELLHESFDSFENSTWIDVAEARGMMLGIALALQASHARDLHHRDLKPLNVMLTQDRNGPPANWVKVIDWGIAMKLDHAAGGEKQSSPSDTASIVEEKLGRMGSLPWMAPEQFSGQTDKRSDIYQFGLIAFELLTGESAYDPPEDELDLVQWQNIHKFRAPKEIRKIRKAVPRHLARVVERCLAKNPADRYADGAELAAALSVERLSLRIKMTIAFLTVTLLFAAIYIFNIDRSPLPLTRFLTGQVGFPFPLMPDFESEEREGLERVQIIPTQLDDLRTASPYELHHDEPLRDVKVYRWDDEDWLELPQGRFIESRAVSPTGGSSRSLLRFDDFAREIERFHTKGTETKHRFAIQGLLLRNGQPTPFLQEFAFLIDERPPRIIEATLELPSTDGEMARTVVWRSKASQDGSTEEDEDVEMRLFVPPLETFPTELDLEITVDETYLEPRGAWLRGRASGEEPGVAVLTRNEQGRERTNRGTRIDHDRFRVRVPLLVAPNDFGAPQRVRVIVTDVAQNSTRFSLLAIFDTGTRAAIPESVTRIEKRPGGHASVPIEWFEPHGPEPQQIEIEVRGGEEPRRIAAQPRLERRDGRIVDVIFPVEEDLLSAPGGEVAMSVWVRVRESFDNEATGYAPPELGPYSLHGEAPFDPEHFSGRLQAEWDDGRPPALLELLPHPDFEDAEVFLLDGEPPLPRRLAIWQTEDEASRRYAVDWRRAAVAFPDSTSAEEASRVPPISPLDARDGKRGVLVDLGGLADRPLVRLRLSAPTFWAESSVELPVLIRSATPLPRLPDVRVRLEGESNGGIGPNAPGVGPLVFDVATRAKAMLDLDWRPTDARLRCVLLAVSGDAPRSEAIMVSREEIEPRAEASIVLPLENASGEPLSEGIYVAECQITDVFGHERDFLIWLSLHGAPPEITLTGCGPASAECIVEARDGKPPALPLTIRDPSGLRRLSFSVDGSELLPDRTLTELTTDESALREIEAEGLKIVRVDRREQRGQVHIVAVDLLYTALAVGDRKKIRVTAWDQEAPERASTRTSTVVCTTDTLPAVVPFYGLDWHRVRAGDVVFYVSEREACRGFYSDPKSFWTDPSKSRSADARQPIVHLSPEEMWTWCRENGFYLPTRSQWQQILNGEDGNWAHTVTLSALSDPNRVTTKHIIDATHCQPPDGSVLREPLAVDETPPGWSELQRLYPGMFSRALHLLGNVEEVIIEDLPPGERIPTFLHTGGSFVHLISDTIQSPRALPRQGLKRMGFRPIVFHQTYEDASGRKWLANEEFRQALVRRQKER